MGIFTMRDIFDVAVKIEEKGEAFYRQTASVTSDTTVQQLFHRLADEEVGHKQVFLKLSAQIGTVKLTPVAREDFLAYLEAYTQNLIFDDTGSDPELVKVKDLLTAVNFAISKEQGSIYYYKEIKELVPISEHALLDNIIEEERRHALKLIQFKMARVK